VVRAHNTARGQEALRFSVLNELQPRTFENCMATRDVPPIQATDGSSASIASQSFWANFGLATFTYLVAVAFTRPIFISDTMYYLRTADPGHSVFWDFGHLIWRPFLKVLLSHLSAPALSDRFLSAFHILDWLSTIAGLITLWFVIATLRLFTRRMIATAASAVLFTYSQAMLTYCKGGCAYVFGLLALAAGFYTLLRAAKAEQKTWLSAAVSGAWLALAVCLWFPYILAVPGTLLAPVVISDRPREQQRLLLQTMMICGLLGSIVYGAVAVHLGIRNLHGFEAWAKGSSHGITISGGTRVVFGFANSFLSLGESGARAVAFKRFLVHDPYNPVSLLQLFGLTLWKIILFYIFLVLVLVRLAHSQQGHCALLELALTALPVLGFAALWQGADLERYLPLFPALMLAVGLGVSSTRFRSATACMVGGFVISLIIANLSSLAAGPRYRQLRQMTTTVLSLNEGLPPESLVLLPPMHPLQRIYWDFPEALPLAEHRLKLERLVDLHTSDTPRWRELACAQMSELWNKQIPVVIESSLLQASPKEESAWVEGDDPGVRWRDINAFTTELELGSRVGNTDFFLIPATERNIEAIDACLSH
jgi:hypothetical protein